MIRGPDRFKRSRQHEHEIFRLREVAHRLKDLRENRRQFCASPFMQVLSTPTIINVSALSFIDFVRVGSPPCHFRASQQCSCPIAGELPATIQYGYARCRRNKAITRWLCMRQTAWCSIARDKYLNNISMGFINILRRGMPHNRVFEVNKARYANAKTPVHNAVAPAQTTTAQLQRVAPAARSLRC